MKITHSRCNNLIFRVVIISLIAVAAVFTPHQVVRAATCTVTTNADSGAGSLREALANSTCTTINFDNDYTIYPVTGLDVGYNTVITGAGHTVTLDGSDAIRIMTILSGVNVELHDLTIANGGGVANGSGIYNMGTLLVEGVTFYSNSGTGNGAAIYSIDTLTVNNSTFVGNTADFFGGGIYGSYGSVSLNNDTFSQNSANSGADVHTVSSVALYIHNTIMGNSVSGGDCYNSGGTVMTAGNNLIEDASSACGLLNGYDGNIIGMDPYLNSLGSNGGSTQTASLQPGSSAIDAGYSSTCMANDQRGTARNQGTSCDIGAYEYVDTTAPYIDEIDIPSTSSSLNIPIGSWGTIEDAHITGYLITESSTSPDYSSASWSAMPVSSYTVPSDGTYYLYPWVKDASGHVSPVYGPVTVVVNTAVPPVVMIEVLIPDPTNDDALIMWQADQTGAYSIRIGGTDCSSGTVAMSGTYSTVFNKYATNVGPSGFVEGVNTVRVCVTNSSGVTGSTTSTVVYDVTAPTVTISDVSPDPTTSYATVTWSADESGTYTLRTGGTNCSDGSIVDTGPYTAYVTANSIVSSGYLVSGSNTIRVCLADAATNTGYAEDTVTYSGLEPSVIITSVQAPTNSYSWVVWYASANGSIEIRSGGTNCSDGTVISTGGTYTTSPGEVFSYISPANLLEGVNIIRICLTDGGGRTGFAQRTILKDTTLPAVYIDNVTPNPTNSGTGIYWHMTERVNYDVRVGGTTCSTGVSVRSGLYSSYPDVTRTDIASSYFTNGVNDIIVCATDTAGNINWATTQVTFDNTAPTVTINSISPNPTNTNSTLRFSANESGSYVIRMGATCSSGTIVTSGSYATPDPIDLVISNFLLSEGANPIAVCVTDSLGNTGLATGSLTYDVTAPVVTIDSLDPPLTNSSVTLYGHANETGNFTIRVGGSDCVTGTNVGSGIYDNISDSIIMGIATGLLEGANTIRLCVADSAGNWGFDEGTVTLDSYAPSINFISLGPDPTASGATLEWSANEDGDYWIQSVGTYCEEGTGFTSGTFTVSGGSITNTVPNSALGEGENPIWICLEDAAGNVGSYDTTLTLDSTSPTVWIDSIYPNPTNAGTDVEWSASEDVDYSIRIGGTDCSDGTVVDSGFYTGPSSTVVSISSTSLAEGSNTLFICVSDAAGNTSQTSGSIVKDTVVPAVYITSAAPDPTTAGTTLEWVSDEVDHAAVYVGGTDCDTGLGTLVQSYSGGGITGASTSIDTSHLAEGENTLRVCVGDAAGNGNYAERTLTKDSTAPTVVIDSILPNPTNAGTTLSWHADEDGYYLIGLNGTSCHDGTTIDSGNYNTSPAGMSATIPVAYLSTGSNALFVCVTDSLSNEGSVSDTIVYDATTPSVTINSINPNPAGASTTVNWNSSEDGSFEVRLDATSCTTGTVGASGNYTTGSAVDTVVDTSSLSDGSYAVYVCNSDAAGNVGMDARPLIIDTTTPVVTLTLDKSRTGATMTTATWSSDDTGTYSVRVGGTDCTTGALVDSGNYTLSGAVLNTTIDYMYLSEGTNIVRVCVTNALNNTGSDDEELVYDITPPTLTVDEIDHTPTNTDVDVTWTVDNAALVLLYDNDTDCTGTIVGGYSDVTGQNVINIISTIYLSEGTNIFQLCASDDVDNVASQTVTIVYDTTTPTVTINSASPNPTNGSTTLSWYADENGDYEIRTNATGCFDGTVVSTGTYSTSPSSTSTLVVAGDLPEGATQVMVCLTDGAGNAGGNSITVNKDITAPSPVINSVTPNPTGAGVTVNWNSGELNSTYSLRLGGSSCITGTEIESGTDTTGLAHSTTIASASLPEGTTTLRLCAADALGNTGIDTEDIIKDTTSPTAVIDSIDPNPTSGGAAVTWHADENGTFSLRVGGSDCATGTESFSGSYTTSPLTVDPFIASTDLVEGTNTIRLCFYDQMGLTSIVTGSVVKDTTAPSITSILRQDPTTTPTNHPTVTFRVTFSEDMQASTIDVSDFIISTTGTATGTLNTVNTISNSVYDVVIDSVGGTGNLTLNISAINNILDGIGNGLGASPVIGTHQSYAILNDLITVINAGVVGNPGAITIENGGVYHSNITTITVTFSSDAANPADDFETDDVTNPNNFILLQPGTDGDYDTYDCSEVAADDDRIPTGPVTYDNNGGAGPYTATVTINGGTPLPYGTYRLLVCGTTSIVDLLGFPLNDGADEVVNFTLAAQATTIPLTGFAQDRVTSLPAQTAAYTHSDLWLEIPALGVEMDIVGIPQSADGTWDVTWLGEYAGWLAGTAYPTWDGNSVITGHVWNADNTAGPFNRVNTLRYGQQIIIHAGGAEYVYEVRGVDLVAPNSTASMLRHQEQPWVTLVTCQGYNETTGSYRYRVLVRAVLIEVR